MAQAGGLWFSRTDKDKHRAPDGKTHDRSKEDSREGGRKVSDFDEGFYKSMQGRIADVLRELCIEEGCFPRGLHFYVSVNEYAGSAEHRKCGCDFNAPYIYQWTKDSRPFLYMLARYATAHVRECVRGFQSASNGEIPSTIRICISCEDKDNWYHVKEIVLFRALGHCTTGTVKVCDKTCRRR